MSVTNSPAFAVLIKACRAAFADDPALALDLSEESWAQLLRLARFHRVQGLASAGLRKTGAPTNRATKALAEDAAAIAASNLRAAAACAALNEAFARAGIPLLFVKGLTLAKLAYGNIATKSSVDIDLLIDGKMLPAATAVLRDCGYRLTPPASEQKLARLHVLKKESTWIGGTARLQVDLHTRLADNSALIPGLGVQSPRQSVEIVPDISLPTLATDALLAYLCVHGASSAWFRLKWITDLAALLQPLRPPEIARLYERSQELGAGRSAGQALLLADALYGTLAHLPELKQRLTADRVTGWLFAQALRQLAGRADPIEPTARRFGTVRIHATQFALVPGMSFKASELVRQARAALL